jgi:Autophagy-related protein 101
VAYLTLDIMNIKEFVLDEIELHAALIDEGVSALLHTILFVRAPNLVKPEDYICKRLAPLSFAKCGPSDVDQTVR